MSEKTPDPRKTTNPRSETFDNAPPVASCIALAAVSLLVVEVILVFRSLSGR